jgi:hypothetical protein
MTMDRVTDQELMQSVIIDFGPTDSVIGLGGGRVSRLNGKE